MDKDTSCISSSSGECDPGIWFNDPVSGIFTKNDCVGGIEYGSSETVTIPAGRFTSLVSKEDANDKAMAHLNSVGQYEANAIGICYANYSSSYFSGYFVKDNCPEGKMSRNKIWHTQPSGRVISDVSQDEANSEAYGIFTIEGQEKANKEGLCEDIYLNDMVSGWFLKKCPFGYKSKSVFYFVDSGRCVSFVSKDDADAMAKELLQKEGREYAEANSVCDKYIENVDQIPDGEDCYW